MSKYISLNNVINGTYFNGEQYVELTEEQREEAFNKIKTFMLSTCRINSKPYQAINRMQLWSLPSTCGMFGRLTDHGYIAGQSYPDEIATLKQLFIKEYK